MIAEKNAIYKKLQNEGVVPIQPMVDFARYLFENKKELGLKLGLASSAPKREILINLANVGLEDAFDVVVSGSDDLGDYVDAEDKNKPKPYIYIEAAKRLCVSPRFCLVFEDTAAGIEAAADAGMIAIAVPNRFTLNQNFSKACNVFFSHDALFCSQLCSQIAKRR